jgi:hypothetical protein
LRDHWALITLAVAATAILLAVGLAEKWDFGETLGVAGLGLSIAGFTLAIVQIQRALTVAQATQAATKKTLEGVAANRLAIVTTQLRQVINELEGAVHTDNAELAQGALNEWRNLGTEALGLLRRRFGEGTPALKPLTKSIEVARTSKAALFAGANDTRKATGDGLEAMTRAADELGPLLEQLLPTMETDRDG